MPDLICPYKPCGSEDQCLGCCHDPEHREMSPELFWDYCSSIKCDSCRYYKSKADLEWVESKCKRLDHKHLQFYKPWFACYDCNGPICSDFEPAEHHLFLYRHWKPEFNIPPAENKTLALFVDGDKNVGWEVNARDFFYGDFINPDGSLRWVSKFYYKKSRSSPIGYVLLREYPDGRVCRYATNELYEG